MLPPAFPAGPRDTGTGSDRPVPEREKGRGGRSPGASGERPPSGGWVGGRSPTGTSSTSAGDVVQHRVPGAPDRCPGRREFLVPAVSPWRRWPGRSGQRPGDGGRPGAGTGGCLVLSPADPRPVRQRVTRLRLPGGSARCPRGAVGGGSRRERSCSEVGRRRRCTVGGSAAARRPRGVRELARPSGGRRSPGEVGDRSACSGGAEDGVQRPAAVVARRAVRRGRRPDRCAGWALEGTGSGEESPGTVPVAPVGAIP